MPEALPCMTFDSQWLNRELLLVKGIASHGFGNWKKIAETVRTHTKEECAAHYNEVYINSKSWPLPVKPIFLRDRLDTDIF